MSGGDATPDDEPRVNLSRARVLLVDGSKQGLKILGQLVAGFGVREVQKATSAPAAAELLRVEPFDLVIVDADLPGPVNGYELIRQLRRHAASPNQQAAIIALCAHTPPRAVARARDCGVSLLIAKPVSPKVLLDRIRWLARDRRDFVDVGQIYVGPDRRFHEQPEPPDGVAGRRRADAKAPVGEDA